LVPVARVVEGIVSHLDDCVSLGFFNHFHDIALGLLGIPNASKWTQNNRIDIT
jgi:hypothetical protein